MSTSAPDSGIDSHAVLVMQSLTDALTALNKNILNVGNVGNLQAASGGAASQPSGQAGGIFDTGTTTTAPNPSAALEAVAAAAAEQQAFKEASAAASAGADQSDPPDETPTAPTSAEKEQQQAPQGQQTPGNSPSTSAAMQALTWESMGSMGGPLGRVKMAQYTVGQYQNAATGLANLVGGKPAVDPNNPNGPPLKDAAGNTIYQPNAVNSVLSNTGVGKIGAVGLTAFGAAFNASSNWANAGQNLGYGNRVGAWGALTSSQDRNNWKAATEQGASLAYEGEGLRNIPGGMTHAQGKSVVDSLANAGFSNQKASVSHPGSGDTGFFNQNASVSHPGSGDNTTIAKGIVAPLVQQGVSASGAAEWSDALRNSGTSVSALSTSLQGLNKSAIATKESTDQFNSSLLEFASSQVANGGTVGQAAQTGMDFTAATGMAPSALGTIQDSPIYQGVMMGKSGTLASNIGNLTPGAQLEGVKSTIQMLEGGLSSLNHNKYETVGGVRVVSSYGQDAVNAQIGTILHMPAAQVERYQREISGKKFDNIAKDDSLIGSPDAGEGTGSGIYQILNRSTTKGGTWAGLSDQNKTLATSMWDKSIAPKINHMGLREGQIKSIESNTNIRSRADMLRNDLTLNQGKSKENQIKGAVQVEISLNGAAKRLLKVNSAKGQMTMIGRAGGTSPNNAINSAWGDAMATSDSNTSLNGYNPTATYPTSPGGF
jgi:hypothetical protein